jgi:peptide/nickel transport system permease protein
MAQAEAELPLTVAPQLQRKPTSLWRDAMRRIVRNRLAMTGAAIIFTFILIAIFAPLIAPYGPTEGSLRNRFKPPSSEFWMGTDDQGRDLYSRIIYGSRVSLSIGIRAVALAITIGTLFGAVSGYVGGKIDNILMRFMDVVLAFPGLLLAIAIVSILGPGLENSLIAITVVSIPVYARVVRASVLALKERDFVLADRSIGVPPTRILFRSILPNVLTPLIVVGTLGIAGAILDTAALSFLGLGAQPPTPEWGTMLGRYRNLIFTQPHTVFFPGIAIMLTVLGFNLLGDGLRDALDPRLRV